MKNWKEFLSFLKDLSEIFNNIAAPILAFKAAVIVAVISLVKNRKD